MSPQLIIAAIDGVIELIGFIQKAAEDSKQNTEWTKAQEEEFDAKIASIGTKPEDQDTGK